MYRGNKTYNHIFTFIKLEYTLWTVLNSRWRTPNVRVRFRWRVVSQWPSNNSKSAGINPNHAPWLNYSKRIFQICGRSVIRAKLAWKMWSQYRTKKQILEVVNRLDYNILLDLKNRKSRPHSQSNLQDTSAASARCMTTIQIRRD